MSRANLPTVFTVREVRVGRVAPLGPNAVPSGIDKQPVSGPVMANIDGMDGDEQGDRRHHGGPDKALHAYPTSNLPLWANDLPEQAALFVPGAFGENLVIDGLDEGGICLGDRWQIGAALCEVSQGRQPCWRLNLRFERPDMAWQVQKSGRTGWYFRVLEPGPIAAKDRGTLLARPNPDWPLTRVTKLLYHVTQEREALKEFAALKGLPESWRKLAEARLASRKTETWTRRIETPD